MADMVKKTKVGMFWNAFEKFGVYAISFVLNVVLARLLSPQDYGTVGLLTVFLTFSNVFIDSGFSRALIQKQDRSELDYSTIFTFNMIVSVVIYAILFFCSPLISKFYKIDELTSLQRVMYLVLIINAISIVQNTKLQVAVDFKKIALVSFLSQIISGIVGIIFAYKGFGAWALVAQSLSKTFVSSLSFLLIARWHPITFFSKDSFKKLFGFGSKLLITGFFATLANNISNLVIGKAYGTKDLGYYTRGYQFPELISGSLASVLNTSTFPLISSLQKQKEELMAVFSRLIRVTFLLTLPMMTGMAVLSKNIISVLLTDKWLPVSFYMSCVSIAYIFRPINILNMNLLNAIGRSDLFMKVDLIKIPIDLAVLAATIPFGIKYYVAVQIPLAVICFFINAFMTGKLYEFGPIKQILCVWKGIVSTLVMGAVVYILNRFLVFNEIAKLVVLIIIGMFSYLIVLQILCEKELLAIEKKILACIKREK